MVWSSLEIYTLATLIIQLRLSSWSLVQLTKTLGFSRREHVSQSGNPIKAPVCVVTRSEISGWILTWVQTAASCGMLSEDRSTRRSIYWQDQLQLSSEGKKKRVSYLVENICFISSPLLPLDVFCNSTPTLLCEHDLASDSSSHNKSYYQF